MASSYPQSTSQDMRSRERSLLQDCQVPLQADPSLQLHQVVEEPWKAGTVVESLVDLCPCPAGHRSVNPPQVWQSPVARSAAPLASSPQVIQSWKTQGDVIQSRCHQLKSLLHSSVNNSFQNWIERVWCKELNAALVVVWPRYCAI